MKKTKLRMLALLLAVVMTVGLLPATAMAADPPQQQAEEQAVPETSQPDLIVPETAPSEPSVETTAGTEPAASDPSQAESTPPAGSMPDESAPTVPPTEPPVETESASTEASPPASPAEPPIMGPVPENNTGFAAMSGFNGVWMQGYVYRVNEDASNFKYTYSLKDGSHTIDLDHLYVMRLRVDGRYKTAYCLEPDTPVDTGEDYGNGTNAGIAVDWNTSLDWQQQKAIGLALLYSDLQHPDSLTSIEGVEWEVATQIIVWEIIMGMRNPVPPYNRTNSALFDQFNGTIRYNDGDDHFLTGVKAKYDSIGGDMSIHEVIPSFTGPYPRTAPTHTMERQPNGSYSVSLTDTNGILSRYPFSSQSPVTIRQSGNKLTATAPEGAAWGELSFRASRNIPNPENPACLFRIFHLGGNNQDMVVSPNNAPYDPVPAYFKLAKKQSPGTAVIRKSSSSGDVQGYCFKLYNWETGKSWYGKTDASGNMYETDNNYNAKTGTYEFTGLFDGEYAFKEVLSVKGNGKVFPKSIRLTVTNKDHVTTFDKTYAGADLRKDEYGDACPINPKIHLTGLTDGGKLTITVNNEFLDGYIQVHKIDENGNDLAGAEFTLTNTATNQKYPLGPTNRSGYARSSNLPLGTYSIEETVVPAGYVKGSMPNTITLTASAVDRTVSFTAVNQRIVGHIQLTKTDSETGKGLSGAVFQVTFPDGTKKNMTESENGVHSMRNLRYGSYKVQEIKAPEGYLLNDTVYKVSIRENGKTYVIEHDGYSGIPNQIIKGHFKLMKLEKGTKTTLQGAEYILKNPAGVQIGKYTTDEHGIIEVRDLVYGKGYTYQEVKAPEGFVLDDTVYTFDVTEHDQTYYYERENTPQPGSISVQKTDTNGNHMAGVTFLLEYSTDDGQTWTLVKSRGADELLTVGTSSTQGIVDGTLMTDADGKITFSGLRIDSQTSKIRYRLTEISTTNGNTLMAGTAFDGHLSQDKEIDVVITAVNGMGFDLPHSGSRSAAIPLIGVVLIGIVLLLTGSDKFNKVRRKDHEA